MEGRSLNAGSYRYGYQGEYAEKDPESGYNSFQLRQYDPRLGRWMKTDPYYQYHSPYMAMGNNPVSVIDPTGGWGGNPDCPSCGDNYNLEEDPLFQQWWQEGGTSMTGFIALFEANGYTTETYGEAQYREEEVTIEGCRDDNRGGQRQTSIVVHYTGAIKKGDLLGWDYSINLHHQIIPEETIAILLKIIQ